jgi:hypothetical protein
MEEEVLEVGSGEADKGGTLSRLYTTYTCLNDF